MTKFYEFLSLLTRVMIYLYEAYTMHKMSIWIAANQGLITQLVPSAGATVQVVA